MILRPSGVLLRAGRILFMGYRYGGQERFNLPGGKPDSGETLTRCLEREVQEELGIRVTVGPLLFVAETNAGNRAVLHLVFQLDAAQSDQQPRLNSEETSASELFWLAPEELKGRVLYPNVGPALRQWLAGRRSLSPYLGLLNQPWA